MIPIMNKEEFTEVYLTNSASSSADHQDILTSVAEIIKEIRGNGETALRKYVEQFDGSVPENWEVSQEEKTKALKEVPEEIAGALERAAANIKQFHSKQLQHSRFMDTEGDIVSGQLFRPIERVGIYVPGGTASYPSTVLMNAIPAVLAGVEEVIMVTPVRDGQEVAPVLLAAAEIAGVDRVFKIGGVQAIASLAYGTTPIPKVDKIVGPGNAYVAAAKSLVYGDVGIDMIAGPSEVAIIADESANPAFIAADLIAQAEHDTASRSVLFTSSSALVRSVEKEVEYQCKTLPRKSIAEEALSKNSALVVTGSLAECFTLANKLAPEHLEVQLDHPMEYLSKIRNAGSVFLGHYTPEALGDYYAGPNHVLPTAGTAKFSSGLSVDDFIKKTTFLYYSEPALKNVSGDIINLADVERLEGHGRAVQIRMDSSSRENKDNQ